LGYGTAAAFPIPVGASGTYYYNVNVITPDTAQASAPNTYAITATPIAATSQAGDTLCATLSINQLGQQTSTGTATAATCWGN
jgi:type IV pilus assembly protein PilE